MQSFSSHIKWYFLLVLVVAVSVVWYAVFRVEASTGHLLLTFFDVGQGDAIFLQTENGNQVLIDGGPGGAVLGKLGVVMPFWDRSIDLLILTHPHADHLDGALEVIKRYDVGMVVESGVNHSLPEYDEWHALLKEKNIKVVAVSAGSHISLSDRAYLEVLTPLEDFVGASPKNIHDAMIVSELHYGSTTALFMGDAEKLIEYQLIFSTTHVQSDVIKIGHHGSKTSSSEDFLKAAAPQFAIISVGRKNRYGHPHQEVLDRLKGLGITTFRTDLDGDVKFISDGNAFKVEKN